MSQSSSAKLLLSRLFYVILVVLIIWLQYRSWYGDNGIKQLQALKIKIEQQADQNELLVEQNKVLKAEIRLLRHDSDALEEKAREHLGLIKKGEIFYRIILEQTPSEL